jgi:hypothetical protein
VIEYFLLLALGLATPGAAAHTRASLLQQEKLSCSAFPVDKSFGKKKLWGGYEVSVGPTAHFDDDSGADDGCTAAIYDPSGKEVYRTTGPGVKLAPATGMDVDGDGAADVVLMNGSNGGSGGSWEIEVVSLTPQPHLLFKFEQDSPRADLRKDLKGRVVLWSRWGGNSDLGYSMAHVNDPSTRIVYRFTEGKLKDVTPEFCGEIENDKHFPRPTEASLEYFKNSKIDSGQFESPDVEGTAGKVMSLALHYVMCRRFDNGLEVIHEMWPKQDQLNLIKKLKEEMSNDQICAECAKAIEKWR